ncbi:hypothetical protein F9C07_2246934 [Aspergillus flavus]|uniref:Uncharacterized protein n=6 Tax=Aspergillus subgen. Circumdati TaxID=2720871 RepID=A0A7U2N238_ASPFN|nr:hypothetical protein AFLA_009085 [Aspergillus flavus NRRL3357]QRD94113.1 hypothetical protein F9C07_2246934 [Aspergillus flavus]RAQ64760.1 hypothetical protein COH21_004690 [Aspergillus flavus]RAQ73159.1 hypothetical protein COH20_012218 [Aspergillus flavus]RMZ41503.1 hypothetical protein CA14_012414 [Aspergillus flavus]
MRYENWDVLLFPENSKVPIQEFKTQCFVIKDRGSPYLHSPALVNPTSYCLPQGNMGLLPVLTTFIPSASPNTPFRVSVHSWERPRPSRLMESLLQPDDALLFEVRIFIDGLFVSGSVFGQRTNWPHVIDLSSNIDKSGNQDNLRFPPFHQEILEQQHWDAGELYGRIRVVISEGFARPHRNPPFERVKEVVAFAFQHAPLQVLEYSSIAWPNASMWSREPRLFKYNSRGELSDLKEPEDSHAHSPTRHSIRQLATTSSQISNPAAHSAWTYRNYQGPIPQMQGSLRESRWLQQEQLMPDPFIDPYVLDPSARHRGARPSSEDISMPDYVSSSTSSRAISHMTGISYEHSKHPSIISPIDEESYNQYFEVLSPPKPLSCGTKAPTNTPSATLPMGRKLSAAAEARSASYINNGNRGSLPKDKSHLGTRDVSEASAKSNLSTEPVTDTAATSKLPVGLNVQVKGRKEGMVSDKKENEITVETPRRESDKAHHAGSKTAVRTSGNLETPTGSRRRRSTGSARRESLSFPKGEPILLSPAQELSEVDDLLRRAGLEELLGPGSHRAGSVAEVAEID